MQSRIRENKKDVETILRTRRQSFAHAWRGIGIVFKTQPNARIQLFIFNIVVWVGLWLKISTVEWLILIMTSGLVIALETINTAFEIDIDLTSPEYHPYAKDTKDVAAGAVLIATLVALSAACIIFIPKLAPYVYMYFL
jgi:diacylglycerol kinase